VRFTAPLRFRTVVAVMLALATFGCANAGSDLTGPGGRRVSLDIESDSSAVTSGWVSSAVDEDIGAVVEEDGAIADAPFEEWYDSSSGYIVAY
jgi:hypothetical protein